MDISSPNPHPALSSWALILGLLLRRSLMEPVTLIQPRPRLHPVHPQYPLEACPLQVPCLCCSLLCRFPAASGGVCSPLSSSDELPQFRPLRPSPIPEGGRGVEGGGGPRDHRQKKSLIKNLVMIQGHEHWGTLNSGPACGTAGVSLPGTQSPAPSPMASSSWARCSFA